MAVNKISHLDKWLSDAASFCLSPNLLSSQRRENRSGHPNGPILPPRSLNLPFGAGRAGHQLPAKAVPPCWAQLGARQAPCRRDRDPRAAAWRGKTGLLSVWGSFLLKKYTTTFIFHFLCSLTDWAHSWDFWVDCFCVSSWIIRVWPVFSYKEFKIKYWEKSAGEWKNHAV